MKNFDLSQDYFKVFTLPVQFLIDESALGQQFQALQGKYHPDKYASKSEPERRLAMQISSLINEAYQTIKDPVKRAIYVMQLNGVDLNTETDTNMDMMFLMQQMELREEMEAISNDEQGLNKIDKIASNVKKQLKTMMNEVEILLNQNLWNKAREILRQVQFMKKIELETTKIQESIEDTLY